MLNGRKQTLFHPEGNQLAYLPLREQGVCKEDCPSQEKLILQPALWLCSSNGQIIIIDLIVFLQISIKIWYEVLFKYHVSLTDIKDT